MKSLNDIAELSFLVRSGEEDKFISFVSEKKLDIKNDLDQSLLHEAIAFHQDGIAAFLINGGIDQNHKDKKGKTPLHYAATYQNARIVKLLLCKSDINALDSNNNTPLFDAFISSRTDWSLVKELLKHGADPYIINKSKNSVAKLIQHSEITELMLLLEEK